MIRFPEIPVIDEILKFRPLESFLLPAVEVVPWSNWVSRRFTTCGFNRRNVEKFGPVGLSPLQRLSLGSVEKSKDLTRVQCHTSVCDMETITTTREFIRNFAARLKKVAANGEDVIVRDRHGQAFVFRVKRAGPSLGEQLSDLCGAIKTGTRVKSLQGFGRNRA